MPHNSKRRKALQFSLGCLLLAVARTGTAQEHQDKLQQATERARRLQAQILDKTCIRENFPVAGQVTSTYPDCIASEIIGLRGLLRDYSLWKLNQPTVDIKQLVDDLRSINDIYVRETVWSKLPSSRKGIAFDFEQTTTTGELLILVSYFSSGAMATPSGIIIIQGFRKEGTDYRFAGETGESVSGVMNLHPLEILPSQISSEMWLLVGGQVGGFMGDLERARIYSFDGYKFRELWKPEDRQDMEITVNGTEIRATYLGPKVYRFGGDLQDHMEERLQLTAGGVLQTRLINHGENPEAK